jgi:F-type H+-transporting ATPase subunit epsilon
MAEGSTTFRAEVLTPQGKVYDGEMFQVSVRTVGGEVGIRARHAPMLARLVPHEMRLFETEADFDSSGGAKRYAAAEGWLEVFANKVTVLVTEAVDPGSLDPADLKERLADAEGRLEGAEEDSAAHRTAVQDKVRAEAFLEIANGN